MEEVEKKKRLDNLDWDWEKLLASGGDGPPPVVVVATTISDTETDRSPPPMSDDPQEQSKRDEVSRMTDIMLEEKIKRVRGHRLKLSDEGEKMRAFLNLCLDERERRKLRRVGKGGDGCEKFIRSKSSHLTSASEGLTQEVSFATKFCEKLKENTGGTVQAFKKELSLSHCGNQKMRLGGQSFRKEQHMNELSSRQMPFQWPTKLSSDVDKRKPSKRLRGATPSPRHVDDKLFIPLSKKRRASQVLPSKDLRPTNVNAFPFPSQGLPSKDLRHTNVSASQFPSQRLPSKDLRPKNREPVVLVDEEEPELVESIEEEELDECMKDSKIYYPSSDDPESIEICYSDMGCLAPKTFLSSTMMNFYIRYLQQQNSPTDRARGDYHIFNTYFYKKLKEAVLNKNDKESLFLKFRRWWKGVNIFRKAFILLPIHESLHWSLVIICIPDKQDESGPIILHLDSLGLHFSRPIFDNVKRFLREEWKYLNQREAPPDVPVADRIWENVPCRVEEKPIAVPQQTNAYDCGLFVLYFMERFMDEAPQKFRKENLPMFGKKWFEPEEASNLRRKIKRLLVEEFRGATKDNFLNHKPSTERI